MILTEAEAKTKVCPFMTRPVFVGGEERQAQIEFVMCQGSACMGWRPRAFDIDNNRPEPRGICGPAHGFSPYLAEFPGGKP